MVKGKTLLATTFAGTPVYGIEGLPVRLRGCVQRMRAPAARGPLAEYLAEQYEAPVVVVVRVSPAFTRAFKFDTDGTVAGINIYKALRPKQVQQLKDEGWIGRREGGSR